MSGQNPHPGDMHHGQIPVGCPTSPPSPPPHLGLDIDMCITSILLLSVVLLKPIHAMTFRTKFLLVCFDLRPPK